MRSLEEVLLELKAAEKEYAEKCSKYGIEEKQKKKKNEEVIPQANADSIEQIEKQGEIVQETEQGIEDNKEKANN